FSSHQLDVVGDLCREVAIMHQGRVVLEGEVKALRAASTDRYVEVTGRDVSWVQKIPGALIVEQEDGRTRVHLENSAGLEEVAHLVAGRDITAFTYEPPPLSEVFRKAVAS
ncbi:MAG: DUF4162 domain-containing protein, partial [Deltaproteobacteria bacterium]|nr:DUF4162 domain-containing protein [Deltaproteobacteria bacterium]